MQIHFYRKLQLGDSLNQDKEWVFDLPENTKLSEFLEFLSLNTNLGNEINRVWEIKENTWNFRKALGFVLIDSKRRIRTLLNNYKQDLLISEIPSELIAVTCDENNYKGWKYWDFTFGTEKYKQMLELLRKDIPHFKVDTHKYQLISDGVLIAKQIINDYRFICVIGIKNHTADSFYTYGQISELDYNYLCNNTGLSIDTYMKYLNKRPLYREGDNKNYFTEEDLSKLMIYDMSRNQALRVINTGDL